MAQVRWIDLRVGGRLALFCNIARTVCTALL